MARSLIIVRAGAGSLHPDWLGAGDRGWDLFVCPYQETGFAADPTRNVEVGVVREGAKWTGLRALLAEWRGWRDYDYVMLADDDLSAAPWTWSRFFEIARREQAVLAQPALTRDSYFSHLVTVQCPHVTMRRTSFVEIMAPCFRTDALAALLPTFDYTRTGWGWGLDYVWAKALGYKGLLIVDEAPVRHTRPVGVGVAGETRQRALAEFAEMMRRTGARKRLSTLEARLPDGRWISGRSGEFLRLFLDGHWERLRGDQRLFDEALAHQLGDADAH